MNRTSATLALFTALAVGLTGCELIAHVDRDEIVETTPEPTADAGPDSDASESDAPPDQSADAEAGPDGADADAGLEDADADAPLDADGGEAEAGCQVANDCPGQDDDCQHRTCTGGTCGVAFTQDGVALTLQNPGDCKKSVCDGAGATKLVDDDADVPDDHDPCTDDFCSGGVASHPPAPANTSCGAGLLCDGNGTCVGCLVDDDCGPAGDCFTRTCENKACVQHNKPTGASVATGDVAGDCRKLACDGKGGTAVVPDVGDVNVDGNDCTDDLCTAGGVPSNPAKGSGASCTQGGGKVCDGSGACVECVEATTCPGADTECSFRTCSNHQCGTGNVAKDTVTMVQQPGDCQKRVCNGQGAAVTTPDDTDVPADPGQCKTGACSAGIPGATPKAPGTTCTENGGALCDSQGTCVECLVADTCPGQNDECKTKTCTSFKCGFSYTAKNTPVQSQTPGDCRLAVCDGQGVVSRIADVSDLPTTTNQCAVPVCNGGSPNLDPAAPGTSCSQNGGKVCDDLAHCVECNDGDDCASHVCTGHACSAAACDDHVKNDAETDVDCGGGGACPRCADAASCLVGGDCSSGYCDATMHCATPSCSDGVKNGDESDTDCGASCVPAKLCARGDHCAGPDDCSTGACIGGTCGCTNNAQCPAELPVCDTGTGVCGL